ncbi:MAG: mitofusin [Alyxoria varia]|nr:MAG: mitofusin [Alyxoria varia]
MSQEYYGGGESSKPTRRDSPPPSAPNFMTVGTGSTSEHAGRLQQMLHPDSGYGGSISDGMSSGDWNRDIMQDQPMPNGMNLSNFRNADRRQIDSSVHQLHYNHNRTCLGRAITDALDTLRGLQEYNKEWPAHYPSFEQSPQTPISPTRPRPSLGHAQSTPDASRKAFASRPSPMKRSETSVDESLSSKPEASSSTQERAAEPRLVTQQLAHEFARELSVLKIEFQMHGRSGADIIHALRKDSKKPLAQLLDGQIQKSMRHLSLLRERIEDTSSKVLVTGDLNAGKSTFCNALLRRKILPEDEQPCTSIFCEVLDVRDNEGQEEVHAIRIDKAYNRHDESTYEVFPLHKLENIVVQNERYSQCKVYVKDIRTVDESLLNNGILDIALIDAPGLNNDSLKTTAVFARQEEIDVVVFVVSAANHFTLSAKEFIHNAAKEKAFMFMVVNGFDGIKNQERCTEKVLEQVARLSPATFKESSDLVHFVSSNAVPVAPVDGPGPNGAPGGGSSSGGASGNDPDDDRPDPDGDDDEDSEKSKDKGKGKEREKQRDFGKLEVALRRFVLEKRARSKLAPAKTYLINVLEDIHILATVNRDVAQSELQRVNEELEQLKPNRDQSSRDCKEVSEELDQSIDDTCQKVYSHTKQTLNTTIAEVSQRDLGVVYPGFWDAYQYAEDIVAAMSQEIADTVGECEEHARVKTGEGFDFIKKRSREHLGDDSQNLQLQFKSETMFRKRNDLLARQIDIDLDVWDFFDVSNIWQQQEKVAGTGMAVTVAGVLGGRLVGGVGWVDGALGAARVLGVKNLRRLFIPGIIATVALGITYAIHTIPTSLPKRLSRKLSSHLASSEYVHTNALRISAELPKALRLPANNLRVGLTRKFDTLDRAKTELEGAKGESEIARKYFSNLVGRTQGLRDKVEGVDLEGGRTWVGDEGVYEEE